MLAAEFEPVEAAGRRRSDRAAVSFAVRVGDDGLDRALCRIVDLSAHGARLQTYSALRRGANISLTLPIAGKVIATVAWATDFSAGCEFRSPLSDATFEALIELDGSLQRI